MDTTRLALLRQLYEKKKHNYRDTRRFGTVRSIDARIEEIKRQIRGVAIEKRTPSNAKFKKLWLEKRLLGWKRAIYTADNRAPVQVHCARLLLQLGDATRAIADTVNANDEKAEQIAILLSFELHDKMTEQLQQLIDQ